MSKVKIQGNASGSGVFTLTTPNTSTDRTITLPDASGTLAFTTDDDDKLPLAGGTMTGATAHGDNIKSTYGAAPDLEIFHDGTHSYIKDVGTGDLRLMGTNLSLRSESTNEPYLNATENGAVELYHNNVKKIETTASGVEVGGQIKADSSLSGDNIMAIINSASDGYGPYFKAGGGNTSQFLFKLLTYNNNEKFRVDGDGKVGIGTASPAYTLEIGNVSSKGWSVNLENNTTKMRSRASANDTQTHWDIMNGNGVVGTIKTVNSSTQFNTSSDYRLKENVDYTWDATTRLKQLKPARFNFISDNTNTLVDGFIAHEVSSIVPEAISGAKDAMIAEVLYVEGDELPEGKSVGDVKTASVIDPQGIDQSKLVPLLVKTIQELEARITALEA